MDLTIGIILFFFEKYYDLRTNIAIDEEYPIHRLNLWNGEETKSKVLYLSREVLEENVLEDGAILLCIDKNLEMDVLSSNYPIILISGIKKSEFKEGLPVDLFSSVFNTLQVIIEKYSNWNKKMDELVYEHATFVELLNLLEETFGLVAVLEDKNYHFIAVSSQYSNIARWFEGGEGSLPNDLLNELQIDEEFMRANSHDEGFIYSYDSVVSYCFNIKMEGNYKGRVMINHKERTYFWGGIAIVSCLAKYLTRLFEYYATVFGKENAYVTFYETIENLIRNIPVSITELTQNLRVKSWLPNHQYQVFLFDFMEKETMKFTGKYYEKQIEKIFGNCCVILFEERICCIQNQSLHPQNDKFHKAFTTFIRENLCKVGSSQNFENLSSLNQYYLQANQALLLGQKSNSTKWHFRFSEMVIPYICNQATLQLSSQMLVHPAYRILTEYDKKNNTSMLLTLYEYIHHNLQVTPTAKCLFIHRTTLTFRLERIQKLTGIDWDNFDEMLHIALSFLL